MIQPPSQRDPIVDESGRVTNVYQRWFADLAKAIGSAAPPAPPAPEPPATGDHGTIQGLGSIQTFGVLPNIVQLSLEGDDVAPGQTFYYGTGQSADPEESHVARGWHPVSGAMMQGPGLSLTIGANGVTTFALEELPDAGGGILQKTERDQYGRLAGTSEATTTDLPEGANLYHTDERVDARIDAQKAQPGGLATLDANAKLDAGQLPAITAEQVGADPVGSAAAAQSAAQSYADGKVTQSITNGDTTHAPSGDAVDAALTGKLDKAGGTIGGAAGGTDPVRIEGNSNLYVGVDVVNLNTATDAISRFRFQTTAKIMGFLAGGANSLAQDGFVVYDYSSLSFVLYASTSSVRPGADNSRTCGAADLRWSTVYAGTGAINTSDAREKEVRGPLNEQEITAAQELASAAVIYQWKAAIAEKGIEHARLHCSPTVQGVIAIMESHGLDPFRYGFVCYDEWGEQPEIRDEWPDEYDDEGNLIREAGSEVTQEYRPAGDRYSLRPTELAHFVMRGLAHRQDELERRLAALESE